MVDARRRSALAGVITLGVAALIGVGFWIGRANPGSTPDPDVLHGTVTLVGGGTQVDEFAVDLDGSPAVSKSYPVGPVPWTNGAGNVNEGNAVPPCVAAGNHITFGVVHVAHASITTDQVVWIDCADGDKAEWPGLRRLRVEGQAGVGEEPGQQVWTVLDADRSGAGASNGPSMAVGA